MPKILISLVITSILFSSLFAITDIAPVDFEDKSTGFSGSVFGSFKIKSGNTNKEEADYGGRIQYDSKKHITWLQANIERGTASDIITEDSIFLHLRHISQLYTEDWAIEYYAQYKHDKFKSIKNRTLYGIGSRYRLVNSKKYGKLFLGVSALTENINYLTSNYNVGLNPDEYNYRISSYISYKKPINNTFDISLLTYYQPKINNTSDFMTSTSSEMTIHLTKVIDLSYIMSFDYDSTPAIGIKKIDLAQKLSFIYRFGKDDPVSRYTENLLK